MRRYIARILGIAFTSGVLLPLSGCSGQLKTTPQATEAANARESYASHEHHEDQPAMPAGHHETGSKPPGAGVSQNTCPVMGNPIDPEVAIEHEGRKIYFCCKPCIDKFQKNPAKYLAKLESR